MFFVHGKLGQQLKRWNLSGTMFLVLRYKGRWRVIFVTNEYTPSEDIKDRIYKEIERLSV